MDHLIDVLNIKNIYFQALKDKDYLQDVKSMLLEFQVTCENKSKKIHAECIKMQLHSINLAHSCRLVEIYKNKTEILLNKLDKDENQSLNQICQVKFI